MATQTDRFHRRVTTTNIRENQRNGYVKQDKLTGKPVREMKNQTQKEKNVELREIFTRYSNDKLKQERKPIVIKTEKSRIQVNPPIVTMYVKAAVENFPVFKTNDQKLAARNFLSRTLNMYRKEYISDFKHPIFNLFKGKRTPEEVFKKIDDNLLNQAVGKRRFLPLTKEQKAAKEYLQKLRQHISTSADIPQLITPGMPKNYLDFLEKIRTNEEMPESLNFNQARNLHQKLSSTTDLSEETIRLMVDRYARGERIMNVKKTDSGDIIVKSIDVNKNPEDVLSYKFKADSSNKTQGQFYNALKELLGDRQEIGERHLNQYNLGKNAMVSHKDFQDKLKTNLIEKYKLNLRK